MENIFHLPPIVSGSKKARRNFFRRVVGARFGESKRQSAERFNRKVHKRRPAVGEIPLFCRFIHSARHAAVVHQPRYIHYVVNKLRGMLVCPRVVDAARPNRHHSCDGKNCAVSLLLHIIIEPEKLIRVPEHRHDGVFSVCSSNVILLALVNVRADGIGRNRLRRSSLRRELVILGKRHVKGCNISFSLVQDAVEAAGDDVGSLRFRKALLLRVAKPSRGIVPSALGASRQVTHELNLRVVVGAEVRGSRNHFIHGGGVLLEGLRARVVSDDVVHVEAVVGDGGVGVNARKGVSGLKGGELGFQNWERLLKPLGAFRGGVQGAEDEKHGLGEHGRLGAIEIVDAISVGDEAEGVDEMEEVSNGALRRLQHVAHNEPFSNPKGIPVVTLLEAAAGNEKRVRQWDESGG